MKPAKNLGGIREKLKSLRRMRENSFKEAPREEESMFGDVKLRAEKSES